jgi:hypothetical protein
MESDNVRKSDRERHDFRVSCLVVTYIMLVDFHHIPLPILDLQKNDGQYYRVVQPPNIVLAFAVNKDIFISTTIP